MNTVASTTARVAEIEERLRVTTPGPWEVFWYGGVQSKANFKTICHAAGKDGESNLDAEFIAHAPEDVAYLLAELRKRDAAIASLSDWAGRSKTGFYDEAQDDVVQIIRTAL